MPKDIRKIINEIKSFLNQVTSEKDLLNKLVDSVGKLEKVRASKKNFFSDEDDNFLDRLKDIITQLRLFVELQEELTNIYDMEYFSDLLKQLNNIKDKLNGLAVCQRVNKKIRELLEKLPAIEQREQNKRHAKVNSRIINLQRNAPKCPKGHHMIIREGGSSGYFWGCSHFPDCWSTRYLTNEQLDYLYDGKDTIVESSNNNFVDTHDEKNIVISTNLSDYLSTSDFADKHGIVHGAVYDYFTEIGWTEKKGNDRRLTELGKEKGGKYKTSSCGKYSWIVWPPDILTEDDLKNIKSHASMYKLEGFISTTKLAKKYDIKPNILFRYLHRIGWIERIGQRWKMTALGQSEIAKRNPQYKIQRMGSLFWPNDLLEYPIFVELLSGESLKINKPKSKELGDFERNVGMKCECFKIQFIEEHYHNDQNKINDFLSNIEVKEIFASFVNNTPPFWSVLIFYKDRISSFRNDISEKVYETNETVDKIDDALILRDDEKFIFQILKKWRDDTIEERKLVSYAIANDKALKIAAKTLPESKDGLLKIKGFSKTAVDFFGDQILNILKKARKDINRAKREKLKPIQQTDEVVLNEKEIAIYQELYRWRNDKAKKVGHSSFTITTNNALKLVAKNLPKTKEDLLEIKGFGPAKVEKYGDEIIMISDKLRKSFDET